MTSFLRNLLRGGQSKHKKLLEDWNTSGKDCDESDENILPPKSMKETVDVGLGVRIYGEYLGSTLMTAPKGDAATTQAIKTVIALAKAGGKKSQPVILYVTLRGIKVFDAITEETQLDISIYRISYCTSDAAFKYVFAFIASNANETMECHAFQCRKRKMAQCATLAIAKIFNEAYEIWQSSHGEPVELPLPLKTSGMERDDSRRETGHQRKARKQAETVETTGSSSLLIDFGQDLQNTHYQGGHWVSFDEDDEPDTMERRESGDGGHPENAVSPLTNVDLLSLP